MSSTDPLVCLLEKFGLKKDEAKAYTIMMKHDGCMLPSELCQKMGVSENQVMPILHGLENKGFVGLISSDINLYVTRFPLDALNKSITEILQKLQDDKQVILRTIPKPPPPGIIARSISSPQVFLAMVHALLKNAEKEIKIFAKEITFNTPEFKKTLAERASLKVQLLLTTELDSMKDNDVFARAAELHALGVEIKHYKTNSELRYMTADDDKVLLVEGPARDFGIFRGHAAAILIESKEVARYFKTNFVEDWGKRKDTRNMDSILKRLREGQLSIGDVVEELKRLRG